MAILTVGTGQTYASITDALVVATAADDICLRSNIINNVILNKNINSIYSDNGSVWDSAGANSTLDIQSGLTQNCTIRNITLTKTAGAGRTIEWSSYGSGVLTFRSCILKGERTSGSAHNIFQSTSNMFVRFEKCLFVANFYVLNAINVGIAAIAAYGTVVINCIFVGHTSRTCINASLSTLIIRIGCYNSTFYSWGTAYDSFGATTCTNNLFIDNVQDLIIGGMASKANYLNCAFGQQGNDGGWDSTIIFGVTSANEVINAAGSDFNLKSTALCRDSGKIITETVETYNDLPRASNGFYDISAHEYKRRAMIL